MRTDPNAPPLPEPLAYFLTWTTYGTWLPGDERGWVRRPGTFEPPNTNLKRIARQLQSETSLILSVDQRHVVENTIREHCQVRGWHLWIVRALSNHVHVVVTANSYNPHTVMDQFKAWCTRKLKTASAAGSQRKNWWTERGSTRYINDDESLEAAIIYVRDFQ
jgi:REP element-mobilizing transposase RayT